MSSGDRNTTCVPTCSALVPDRHTRWLRDRRCSRKGSVCRNGTWYCKQHDPEVVKAKREAQRAAWEREAADRRAHAERLDAVQDACEGVETSDLRPGLLRELLDKLKESPS